ncbi:MAG: nuclear transport factor 2 family protein [Pseudomonadota bacterium]
MSGPGISTAVANKTLIHNAFYDLCKAPANEMRSRLEALYAPNCHWRGSHPLNEMNGLEAVYETVWAPLRAAMPDMERRDFIVVAGEYKGQQMVAVISHILGTFDQPWLTIPATGHPVMLRCSEVHIIEDGQIVQSTCLWDVMDLMRQAGFWPVAPSTGIEMVWPGPLTNDGVRLYDTDPAQGAASLTQTMAMHKTLADYDDLELKGREGLINMPQREHWHDRMMWYGPAGIGSNRGLAGFVDYHQLPFRLAFPNRKGGAQLEGRPDAGHYIRIGDGPYSVTGGWPSVVAQHTGQNFMGAGANGGEIRMRVMDFYLHHEGKIRENWVPIDTIDVLLQMGVDVFDRMQTMFKRGF